MMAREITIVLHNIRSVYNVGAILRTAEGLGVAEAVFSGYTPRYEDQALLPHLREKLNRQIEKSALGAEKMVPQEAVEDLPAWLATKRAEGWTIVGLENNLAPEEMVRRWILGKKAPSLGDQGEEDGENGAGEPKRVVLVLGEEVHGIPTEVRREMDFFLEIPMHGRKESFNVSVATGIALWGLLNAE